MRAIFTHDGRLVALWRILATHDQTCGACESKIQPYVKTSRRRKTRTSKVKRQIKISAAHPHSTNDLRIEPARFIRPNARRAGLAELLKRVHRRQKIKKKTKTKRSLFISKRLLAIIVSSYVDISLLTVGGYNDLGGTSITGELVLENVSRILKGEGIWHRPFSLSHRGDRGICTFQKNTRGSLCHERSWKHVYREQTGSLDVRFMIMQCSVAIKKTLKINEGRFRDLEDVRQII